MKVIKATSTIFFFSLITSFGIHSQTNIFSTNTTAEEILQGNYNPNDYSPTINISAPSDVVNTIYNSINADSIKSYLEVLSTFTNRNSGSDTVSTTFGIGASRRWIYQKFEQFSAQNENRLVTSYLQFDRDICGMNQHRNVFTVLPGTNNSEHQVIIIEGHFDSRCEDVCDVACDAHGMEDNGSGTALVMELARVMGKLSLENTIVFMATTAEEQGLYGADAFADYALDNNIPIKAVFNNDVIGGIICGETSSAPSCPGENHIDSTQVRIFSGGSFNSPSKQLARFTKMEYKHELEPIVSVPMMISIMSAEDRTGRGGDHIPFRQAGFPAIRFTSANEHGNASNGPDYHDRQHTTDDILGVDTEGDMILDSFFVDFNYLARNTTINGNAVAMAAIGPKTPDFTISSFNEDITVEITDQTQYNTYMLLIRSNMNDFDTVFTFSGSLTHTVSLPENVYRASVCSVDEDGIESLFSREEFITTTVGVGEILEEKKGVELFQNRPNPFDEATTISAFIENPQKYQSTYIVITDLTGKQVERIDFTAKKGINEVLYNHGYKKVGTFSYTLYLNNKPFQTKKMVFAY